MIFQRFAEINSDNVPKLICLVQYLVDVSTVLLSLTLVNESSDLMFVISVSSILSFSHSTTSLENL